MHIALVSFEIKPECLHEFLACAEINARSSMEEPGVVAFDVYQQKENPNQITFYELYKSEHDNKLHWETPHFIDFRENTRDMIINRTRLVYRNIYPPDSY
jgi:autoinducer 2-degrading protein